jgi:hypothetical protein
VPRVVDIIAGLPGLKELYIGFMNLKDEFEDGTFGDALGPNLEVGVELLRVLCVCV